MTTNEADNRIKQLRSRRNVLTRVGTAAAIGVGGLWAGSRPVLAQTEPADTDSIEKIDTTISSFDNTTIALSLYKPTTDGPHPALFWLQGGGRPRASADQFARFWAANGYVVLTFDPRGIAESGGKLRFASQNAVRDISKLVDFLSEKSVVETNSNGDPRVGMEGSSFGSWLALLAASHDDRIDAITGFIAPYNASTVVARNEVLNWPWAYFMWIVARAPHISTTDDVLKWTQEAIETKEAPQELIDFLEERSPKTGLSEISAPTMIINGWHDRVFPAQDSFDIYDGLASADDRRLVLWDPGHDFEGSPITPTQFQFRRRVRVHWFAKHLKGEGPPEDSPLKDGPIHFYHAQSDSFESYEALPDSEMTFDLRDSTERGATYLTTGRDGNKYHAEFDFPVDADLELAGVSHLSLAVTPTGGDPHVFAALEDVPPDDSEADPVHIKDQITPLKVTDPGTVEFDLSGVRHTVNGGHTLRLILTLNDDELAGLQDRSGPAFTDGLFVDSKAPAGLTIHHSEGRSSTLQVTITD